MTVYRVTLCTQVGCQHPAGQHILGGGCRLCDVCPGWDEAMTVPGRWSDEQQQQAELEITPNTDQP